MIVYEKHQNIFASDLQTLVCPVNTQGVMGAGLARQMREMYPGLLGEYRDACRSGVFARRQLFVYTYSPQRKILCLPTKRKWALPSRLEWIVEALIVLAHDYEQLGITSLAIPPIGCGKGQLEWEIVYPLIHQYLGPLPLKVGIHLP